MKTMHKPILAIVLALLCAAPLTVAAATSKTDSGSKHHSAAAAASPTPSKKSFWQKIWPFHHHAKKAPKETESLKDARRLLHSVSSHENKKSKKKESDAVPRKASQASRHSEKKEPAPSPRKTEPKPAQKIEPAKKQTHIPVSEDRKLEEKKPHKKETQFSKPIAFVPENNPEPAAVKTSVEKNDLIAKDASHRQQFEALKSKALKDPKIEALKEKADSALTTSEANRASKAYYRALFSKIKKLGDASMQGYIGNMEKAILGRLENN